MIGTVIAQSALSVTYAISSTTGSIIVAIADGTSSCHIVARTSTNDIVPLDEGPAMQATLYEAFRARFVIG